jgi:hypothetical protein
MPPFIERWLGGCTVEEGRVFGRTSLGGQEILQKSGRLTQTERLVLIVLGDQVGFETLAAKLSSLASERVERALIRLVELNLAYEILLPAAEAAGAATIPAGAMREFLEQGDADPVTVMANTEQLDAAERARVLKDAVGQVLGGDGTANVAVPLGKLFPASSDPTGLVRNERREVVQSKLGALEQSLDRARVPSMAVPAPPLCASRRSAAQPVPEEGEAVIIETPKNSSAGGVMMLIGGVAAVLVVATILLYALR